jgi:hypothetical protein
MLSRINEDRTSVPIEIIDRAAIWDLLEAPSWHERAACRGTSVEIITPTAEELKMAKEMCSRCGVHDLCGDEGARTRSIGVWGGRLRKTTARAPKKAA